MARNVTAGLTESNDSSRQLHWLPVHIRVDFKISTLVYHSLAGTAAVYLADECNLVTTTGLCDLLTIERAWSRDHASSSVTTVLPPPGQCCGTVCLNSIGNRTSPSENSNDHWKRLCLVSWAAAPCVWTLRVPTRNLLTYLPSSLWLLSSATVWRLVSSLAQYAWHTSVGLWLPLCSQLISHGHTLLFDRFLIMYNLCVFTCIIVMFVFHCTHVRMSYVLNSYLLTYWVSVWPGESWIITDYVVNHKVLLIEREIFCSQVRSRRNPFTVIKDREKNSFDKSTVWKCGNVTNSLGCDWFKNLCFGRLMGLQNQHFLNTDHFWCSDSNVRALKSNRSTCC